MALCWPELCLSTCTLTNYFHYLQWYMVSLSVSKVKVFKSFLFFWSYLGTQSLLSFMFGKAHCVGLILKSQVDFKPKCICCTNLHTELRMGLPLVPGFQNPALWTTLTSSNRCMPNRYVTIPAQQRLPRKIIQAAITFPSRA